MIRAVIDANVAVSAVVAPHGAPGQVFERLFRVHAFVPVISSETWAELERVFAYSHVLRRVTSTEGLRAFLRGLQDLAVFVPDSGDAVGVCRDPEDDRYLSAALEGRAGFVVTGDRDLLDLGTHRGVAIVTPRRFLDLLDG